MPIMDINIKVGRIYRMNTERPLKAFADIVINDALLIKGVKVIDGKRGLFVSMPQEQAKNEQWYDSVRPMNQEIREMITQEVLTAYKTAE